MPETETEDRTYWTVSHLQSAETATQHGQTFPKVGGKLRLLREHRPNAGIHTEPLPPIEYQLPDGRTLKQARFHATVHTEDGAVIGEGTGTATWGREENHDGEMQDIENVGNENVVMLAETRAVARALRFAGYAIDAADYSEVRGKDPVGDPDARAATPPLHQQPKGSSGKQSKNGNEEPEPITEKQLPHIRGFKRKGQHDLNGKDPEDLTKEEASDIMSEVWD